MNIKGLIPTMTGIEATKPIERVARSLKADHANDREPNGQHSQDRDEQKKPPMTEEQLQKALKHLEGLKVVQEHKWSFQIETAGKKKHILVLDNLGTIIRKIPEDELWTLPDLDDPRGHLLKKSA